MPKIIKAMSIGVIIRATTMLIHVGDPLTCAYWKENCKLKTSDEISLFFAKMKTPGWL